MFLELLQKTFRISKLSITIVCNKEMLNINDSFRAYNNITIIYYAENTVSIYICLPTGNLTTTGYLHVT